MQIPSLNSGEIIAQMQQLVPPGSGEPMDPTILSQLSQLTQALIQAYQAMGRLAGDPFFDALTRPLYLYEAEIRPILHGKTALVTGGEGCVGSHLIRKLLDLGITRVVSVDHVRCQEAAPTDLSPVPGMADAVALYAADIRDLASLEHIFQREKPHLVFHAAAQRQPGLAEKQVRDTITSNILGTQNVIRLCEAFQVEQCIFSSTGKASRYFTAEVYAASKKMAEWLFAQAVQTGSVRYGMVRFTHMLDNSLMRLQVEDRVAQGQPVNVHAPDRYVTAQNVTEAVHMMLNSLVLSEPQILKFVLVRNLGWPTESLEVALYNILKSGQALPIYFQGVLPGYEESFFLGQVDWDDQIDINTLINALETSYHSTISASGDMIVAELFPFSSDVLNTEVAKLNQMASDTSLSETVLKQGLADAVRAIARSSFDHASPQKVLKILRWGVNPKQFHKGELKLELYQDFIELLVNSLVGRLSPEVVTASHLPMADVEEMLSVLATLESVQPIVTQLQAAIAPACV